MTIQYLPNEISLQRVYDWKESGNSCITHTNSRGCIEYNSDK